MSDSLSFSNTISKQTVLEKTSMTYASLEDAKKRENDAISNERIKNGDMILDTYEVTSDAISGGMGSVWRVHHNSWNTDLAMKRPQPRYFAEGSDKRKEQFIRECEHWIDLGLHPNIVSCYYVREIGGVPTIFSEWMDGGSLKDRIQDGSLYDGTEQEVQERILDIAIQAARGLQYSHENGLIHQDMKPGNLLLSKEWDAKVADFGLAKAKEQLDEKSDTAKTTGYTLAYCPKEQTNGETPEKWMDVYAWALTVLEMYAGKRLWETGAEAKEFFDEYPSQCVYIVPDAFAGLLRSCLRDKPDCFSDILTRLLQIYSVAVGSDYPRPDSDAAADTVDSLNNRALSYIDLGKTEEGIALLDQAVDKDTSHTNSVFNRALALWRTGKIDRKEAESFLVSLKDDEERAACQEALHHEVTGYIDYPDHISEEAVFDRTDDENQKRFELRFIERSVSGGLMSVIAQVFSLNNITLIREFDVFGGPLKKTGRKYPLLAFTPDYPPEIADVKVPTRRLVSKGGKFVFVDDPTPKKAEIDASYNGFVSEDGAYVGFQKHFSGYNCTYQHNGAEIYEVATGKLLSRVTDCELIGFTWDNRVLLYDENDYLHFSGTPDNPLPENGLKLYIRGIDKKNSSFLQLSERIGMFEISVLRRCFCDLQRGVLLGVSDKDLDVYSEIEHDFWDCFTLTGDEQWFLWLHVSSKEDVIDAQVWNTSAWQYMEHFIIDREGARDTLPYLLAHKDKLRYVPRRTDYRISTVESTKHRLTAQDQFDALLQRAREEAKSGGSFSAIGYLDEAMTISGFETSPKALRLRTQIGSELTKRAAQRIVPVDTAAPKEIEVRTEESYEGQQLAEKIKEEVLPHWQDNDPYSDWSVYAKIGQKSANGKFRLIHYVIIEYRDSPAQYDPEITHWHGCAVMDIFEELIIWQKDYLYMHDAPTYNNGNEPDFFTEFYQTDISADGSMLLVRGDGISVIHVADGTRNKLICGRFIFACFIANDRFVLCQSEDKTMHIIDLEGCTQCGYHFPKNEYGTARCLDDDSFAIRHGDKDQLCLIEWEYGSKEKKIRSETESLKDEETQPFGLSPSNNFGSVGTGQSKQKRGFIAKLFGKE